MYSIDLEQEVQGFSIDNVSEIDSIRLEMKKLSYNVSGLEVPDTLTIEASSETLSYLNTQKEKQKAPWLRLPKIPKKEMASRKRKWKARKSDFGSGTLWKYAQTVGPAYLGAPTHPGKKKEVP